jgi:sucrose phosphorylase
MNLKNQIMMITYANSLGKNLKELHTALNQYFRGAVGGVHILPFFPSSADRGFAPMRYDTVDPNFGDFADIEKLGEDYFLMFDFMVNHLSRSSDIYLDFAVKKDASKYKDFSIRYKDFWQKGEPTDAQLELIYKRKPRSPHIDIKFADGTSEKLWCTFGDEQVDINVKDPAAKAFIRDTLVSMCKRGAAIIRLDAFAYAVKKPGTNCFFIKPEIWELLREIEAIVTPYGAEILPEIHEHYTIQHEIAAENFWIYDFALPVLTLHALYSGKGQYLKAWLDRSPRKQFTTLDTHDGIGIVDVKGLLPEAETEFVKKKMFSEGANVNMIYNSAAYNNLDIYQVNTTYYSALGNKDSAYLLSRAIQFFAPGIPQVYYVGLLAGENDVKLAEQTKNGRDINRHSYTLPEIEQHMNRSVVQNLLDMMKLRNTHSAFALDAEIEVTAEGSHFIIKRIFEGKTAILDADLRTHAFGISAD